MPRGRAGGSTPTRGPAPGRRRRSPGAAARRGPARRARTASSGRRWSIDAPLRGLEPVRVERLDGVGGAVDDRVRVLVRLEVGEHPVGELAGIAALRPAPRRPAAGGSRGRRARRRPSAAPLCPARPPPRRSCSRPVSRSLSSWTTSTSSGSSLKKRAAACTARPESFMKVSGLSSATLCPSMRISASRPLNFERHWPSCRRASSSTTSQPTLCRLRAYSAPGLPRPATSRSSEVPCRRGQSRIAVLAFGVAVARGGGFGFGGRLFTRLGLALGGRGLLGLLGAGRVADRREHGVADRRAG